MEKSGRKYVTYYWDDSHAYDVTFTLHVEHEIIGGETVLEKFEGVEQFNNPPMTSTLHLSFDDENRGDKQLDYGHVVRAVDTNHNND